METIENVEQELFVRELLEKTYEKLGDRNPHIGIVLPETVKSEIADDSDWHRTRVGYMGYDKVRFFSFNNKSWLIGNGKSCGAYPARPYDSDILALELAVNKNPSQVYEQFKECIGSYFKNSLIFGMADGVVSFNKHGRFTERMMKQLSGRIEEFVAKWPKYNREILSLDTLTPINTSSMKYKQETVDFLAETIETVLEQS